MSNHDTTQKPSAPPCPYLSIPLEVAQDEYLSDGAILLFGEVYGLQRVCGHCFASDAHFQARRGKGRSTIQRQITELSGRGHLYVVNDGKGRRELRVAERYLSGKDRASRPENGNEAGRCPENRAGTRARCLEIENGAVPTCPKNETNKTPESKTKNPEKRTTPSLSSRVVPLQLSPDEEKQVMSAVRLLDDARNEADYRSLFLQASERGRLDAWEVAVASTQRARLRSGKMQKAPIAYFRTVLMRSWDMDRHYLQVKSRAAALSPSPAPMSTARVHRVEECPDDLGESDFYRLGRSDLDDEALHEVNDGLRDDDDLDDEADTYSRPFDDGGRRHGSDAPFAAETMGRRGYCMPCPPQRSEAAQPPAVFSALLSALPAERRANVLTRAEDEVRRRNLAFWSNAKGTRAGERLIQQQVREIVEMENLNSNSRLRRRGARGPGLPRHPIRPAVHVLDEVVFRHLFVSTFTFSIHATRRHN